MQARVRASLTFVRGKYRRALHRKCAPDLVLQHQLGRLLHGILRRADPEIPNIQVLGSKVGAGALLRHRKGPKSLVSRVGLEPVPFPAGVVVTVEDNHSSSVRPYICIRVSSSG